MNNGPVHFIAGLPRSGSTLLCGLLRQNPRFCAAVTSPVLSLINAVIPRMGASAGEFAVFFNAENRRRIIRSVFDGYHHAGSSGVLFDTNRLWTGKLPLIREVFPGAKVICCVRHVGWVLDSIERQTRAHPLEQSRMIKSAGGSIYQRASALMNSETGLVGQAWSALREAWFSDASSSLLMLDYDRFVRAPESALAALYGALGEPRFAHDIENVQYEEPEYDAILGSPNLHKVHGRVEHQIRPPCIPPDLLDKYAEANFWARPGRGGSGVTWL